MKKILQKYLLFGVIWLTLLLIIQNPAFQALNIYYSTTQQITSIPTGLNGLIIQGSSIVNYQISQYLNGNQTVYYITISVLNTCSLMLLVIPFLVFIYLNSNNQNKKINKNKINKKLESEK